MRVKSGFAFFAVRDGAGTKTTAGAEASKLLAGDGRGA